MFDRDCTTSSCFINYSTLNIEHDLEDYFNQGIRICTSQHRNHIVKGPIFSLTFVDVFIVDLLMQDKFETMNVINRRSKKKSSKKNLKREEIGYAAYLTWSIIHTTLAQCHLASTLILIQVAQKSHILSN